MARDPASLAPFGAVVFASLKWITFFAGVILLILAYDASGERTVRCAAIAIFCGVSSRIMQAEEHHIVRTASSRLAEAACRGRSPPVWSKQLDSQKTRQRDLTLVHLLSRMRQRG